MSLIGDIALPIVLLRIIYSDHWFIFLIIIFIFREEFDKPVSWGDEKTRKKWRYSEGSLSAV